MMNEKIYNKIMDLVDLKIRDDETLPEHQCEFRSTKIIEHEKSICNDLSISSIEYFNYVVEKKFEPFLINTPNGNKIVELYKKKMKKDLSNSLEIKESERDIMFKTFLDKDFLDKLKEVGRLYGWYGDYTEVADFIEDLYIKAGLEVPKNLRKPYNIK